MTTFAYSRKESIIAIDGRISAGSRITSDKYKKWIKKGDNVYFFVGTVTDAIRLIDLANSGFEETDDENLYECSIVLACDPPKEIYVNEAGYIEQLEITEDYCTLGSGGDYALSAMDMGKTAKQAVEYAMTRDIYTGGRVTIYNIKTGKFK